MKIQKKVALYNGLKCHHEMIGHALDYCKQRDYIPVIYINNNKNEPGWDDHGWIEFYKNKYNDIYENIDVYNHTEFPNHHAIYDIIFLLTDDDWVFPENIVDTRKIICIDHWFKIRRNTNIKRIDIRPFTRTENDKWMLPVYEIISKKEKLDNLNIVKITKHIHVACIGYGGLVNIEQIKKYFTNFDKITFHIFNRTPVNTNNYTNVFNYVLETSTNMINMLKVCQYSLFIPFNTQYYEEKMSGSVPLALSIGCRIITTQKLKELYKFTSCMVIDPDVPIELPIITENETELVYEELQELIKRRDMWYDSFISEM